MSKNKYYTNRSVKISLIRIISVPSSLLIFLLIFGHTIVFAQESFTITNYFTQDYRDFPMMKISIIPPSGFPKDTDQAGFLDPKDAAAIRADEIKLGAHEAATGFIKKFDSTGRNDSLGLKLLQQFNFRINGYEALLVNVSGIVEGEEYLQWWIFIGDKSDTYIVKGFIPAKKKNLLESQVRTSLLSVFFEPDRRLILPGTDPTTTSTSSCSCHNQK